MPDFIVGKKLDFGSIIFSEKDIMDFAKAFDPLDFHLDKEIAGKSVFKGLIASGPHLFNHVYRNVWIPRYGKTVICGMGVYNWKFIRPVYAGVKIHAEVTILSMKPDEKVGGTAVMWQFEFKNEKGEMVQILQTEVMHKIP